MLLRNSDRLRRSRCCKRSVRSGEGNPNLFMVGDRGCGVAVSGGMMCGLLVVGTVVGQMLCFVVCIAGEAVGSVAGNGDVTTLGNGVTLGTVAVLGAVATLGTTLGAVATLGTARGGGCIVGGCIVVLLKIMASCSRASICLSPI